jgi:hypothetical protein
MFTLITSAVGKVRLWIRLSLMSKTLVKQLSEVHFTQSGVVTKQSLLARSGTRQQLFELLSTLDCLSLQLYIREGDIGGEEIAVERLFRHDGHGDRLDFTSLSITMPVPSSHGTMNRTDTAQLEATLRSQIGQRLYFEEECRRLQERVVELEQRLSSALKSDPRDVVAFRLAVAEERLRVSELCRRELEKRLLHRD